MGVEHLSWLSNLTKALAALLKAIAERLALWIEYRKPKLYLHFNLGTLIWCIAHEQQSQGPPLEMMQVMFSAGFNHDDPKQTLVITDAYPQGTMPQLAMLDRFKIPPQTIVTQQVMTFVAPVAGEKGNAWVGRIVLVDQFERKYKAKKATFRRAG